MGHQRRKCHLVRTMDGTLEEFWAQICRTRMGPPPAYAGVLCFLVDELDAYGDNRVLELILRWLDVFKTLLILGLLLTLPYQDLLCSWRLLATDGKYSMFRLPQQTVLHSGLLNTCRHPNVEFASVRSVTLAGHEHRDGPYLESTCLLNELESR